MNPRRRSNHLPAARRRVRDERGASLVEFALVAPALIVLVFGIIDFGWIFAQHQDVRHGSREGARLAAVNWSSTSPVATGATQTNQIQQAVCVRTGNLTNGPTKVKIDLVDGSDSGTNPSDLGDTVKVTVDYPTDSLTGFFDFLGITLTSTSEMRLEQDATFAEDLTGTYTCT